jgi:hypothetical protein
MWQAWSMPGQVRFRERLAAKAKVEQTPKGQPIGQKAEHVLAVSGAFFTAAKIIETIGGLWEEDPANVRGAYNMLAKKPIMVFLKDAGIPVEDLNSSKFRYLTAFLEFHMLSKLFISLRDSGVNAKTHAATYAGLKQRHGDETIETIYKGIYRT